MSSQRTCHDLRKWLELYNVTPKEPTALYLAAFDFFHPEPFRTPEEEMEERMKVLEQKVVELELNTRLTEKDAAKIAGLNPKHRADMYVMRNRLDGMGLLRSSDPTPGGWVRIAHQPEAAE